MPNLYNSVAPISLGQSRQSNPREAKKRELFDEDITLNDLQDEFPLSKYTVHNGEIEMKNDTLNLDFVNAKLNNQKALPKPTYSGTLGNTNSKKSMKQILVGDDINHEFSGKLLKKHRVSTGSNQKKSHKMKSNNGMNIDADAERLRKRAAKFESTAKPERHHNFVDNFNDLNANSTKSQYYDKNKHIVGRCQDLEKSYLRLTSEPNPDLIRPLGVLKKTYQLLIKKHKQQQATYKYLCDQFKSMRQDLRVQIIENQFTVKVYQTHARIALENHDIGEFNQCQSRLRILYGKSNIKPSYIEEFTAYQILYYILTEDFASISKARLKLMKYENHVYSNYRVRNAFELATAVLTNNYHLIFKHYANLQDLEKNLADTFVDRLRLKALVTICRSYNQLSLPYLINLLNFESLDDIRKFLDGKHLGEFVVTKNKNQENEFIYLDTRNCRAYVSQHYSASRIVDIKGQQ